MLAIKARGSISGINLFEELRDLPEMSNLLAEIFPLDNIMVNIREHLDRGFDGETLNSCDCPSGYCGRFRHINIKYDSLPKMRGTLIFELTNIMHAERFAMLAFNLRNRRYLTAETYAKEAEKIEFAGVITALKIEEAINSRLGKKWINSGFSNVPKRVIEESDFENYYSSYLSDRHKEYYRSNWYKRMNIKPINNKIRMFRNILIIGVLFLAVKRIFY